MYIILSIIGIILLFSLLIFFIISYHFAVNKLKLTEKKIIQLQQENEIIAIKSALDAETAERTRLARDLHDGLGGMLSVLKLHLNDAENSQNARNMLDKSIDELHRVAHHLMPASLLRDGLKTSLEDFCLAVPNANFDYFGDNSRFDDRIEVLIYRCAHELINNAVKYANADNIYIQLFQEPNRISLIVEDDGCGFDVKTASYGMGLENIRTRIAAVKGTININSTIGKGTEVYIEVTGNR
jgi:signal transduction histidine kinase